MTEYQFETSEPSSALPSRLSVQHAPNTFATTEQQIGNLTSFIFHVAYLEKVLREEGTSIFLNENIEADTLKTKLDEGGQSSVYRAESKYRQNWKVFESQKWVNHVAIKTVKSRAKSNLLLEVRALMHPFLRYHPNIVKFLGFTWSSGNELESVYPMLIMEYAKYGSLSSLQESNPRLPVQVKQKICYDIARGLAIIHACGIVHGDLKHENVLVFDNPYDQVNGQPYLAKLGDFGGAAMDISLSSVQSLKLGTFPYEAPEASKALSAAELKETDVFSFGMLVWRALLDGKPLLEEFHLTQGAAGQAKVIIKLLKEKDKIIEVATHSVTSYVTEQKVTTRCSDMIVYVLHKTLGFDPVARSLPHAQAALRGMELDKIDLFIENIRASSDLFQKNKQGDGISRRTIDVDSVGFGLGRLGDFYDAQENIPGYRPELSHPETGTFLFEPLKLKQLLTWNQQQQIVEELKTAARATYGSSAVELQPFRAACYLFQSYLVGFGVHFDAPEVCYWLNKASKVDEDGSVEYLAQAWLWRICNTLDRPQPVKGDSLIDILQLAVFRGHTQCLTDFNTISSRLTSEDERVRYAKESERGRNAFLTIAGGVGMPHYTQRNLRNNWNLDNLLILDTQISDELGDKYNSCLCSTPSATGDAGKDLKDSPFNKIFVNHVGHGLLHYAATFGKLKVLEHLITTYKCNINMGNEHMYETPLVSAVRSAQYECAIFLIDSGANPGKPDLGVEAPLHWLCALEPRQVQLESLAKKLIGAGADLEEPCGTNSRDINADWEELLQIQATPLGRAVIMRSVPAVRVLLGLGANPKSKASNTTLVTKSAIELAAVLMYPETLEILLHYLDKSSEPDKHIFDEIWILQAAHDKTITKQDPTTFQSRLVRLGTEYKSATIQTLRLLHDRAARTRSWQNTGSTSTPPGKQLCTEIRLGNRDIVEALLDLGHDANGSIEFRPLETAVSTNNTEIFRLLLHFGADVTKGFTIEDGRKYSFLQILACRPQSSPSGLWIAEYLINAKLPIEPIRDGSRSAFALAVDNQYFDLADLLLAKGADVNIVYQHLGKDGQAKSLLGNLISEKTERSLESIRYLTSLNSRTPITSPPVSTSAAKTSPSSTDPFALLQAHFSALSIPEKATHIRLSPIANPSLQMNIFHQLAWSTADSSSTTIRIIHLLLTAFPEAKDFNCVHPVLGTPLCIAALSTNFEMVMALLGLGDTLDIELGVSNVETTFAVVGQVFGLKYVHPEGGELDEATRGMPLFLALAAYRSLLDELSRVKNSDPGSKERLITSERIISKLLARTPSSAILTTAETHFGVLRQRRVSY